MHLCSTKIHKTSYNSCRLVFVMSTVVHELQMTIAKENSVVEPGYFIDWIENR